ncbi:hypothetical protein L596_024893 [Steinernema carpocapsae]|nr:hypothetical protein L596_024893 [Steinernema carpocapsae]
MPTRKGSAVIRKRKPANGDIPQKPPPSRRKLQKAKKAGKGKEDLSCTSGIEVNRRSEEKREVQEMNVEAQEEKTSVETLKKEAEVAKCRPGPSGVLTPVQEISVEESASVHELSEANEAAEEASVVPENVPPLLPPTEEPKINEIVSDPVPADPVTTGRSPRGRFVGVAKSMSFLKKNTKATDQSQVQSDFLSRHGMAFNVKESEENHIGGNRLKYLWSQWVCDKSTNFHYYWTMFVSLAYTYNLLVVIARIVYTELSEGYFKFLWLVGDLLTDLIYILDMWIKNRTGFLEQGTLVRELPKIRKAYFKSAQFKMDILSLLPLDLLGTVATVVFGPLTDRAYIYVVFRFNRLIRFDRMQEFVSRTETRSSYPNVFRIFCVISVIIVIIHWNACFYFLISSILGIGSDSWVYGKANKQALPEGVEDTLTRRYIYSFYWSCLVLTTIGEVPWPVNSVEIIFVTVDLMCGVLIFATIVGNVGSMISNMGATKADFQNKMDEIKQYMRLRNVSKQLQIRVVRWFDYLWANKQGLTDAEVLKILPDKLQVQIAMHVHFETLRKDCEAGLLAELVLKLQLQVFSPNDYVCKTGDIGREMYIVKRGRLRIERSDGKVLATMSEGSVFGELSILNIPGSKNGNRRTANIVSIGYTDLFVLSKMDLMNALKEYPEAKNILMKKGREILKRDNLLDETAPEETRSTEEVCEMLKDRMKMVQVK